MQNNQQTILRPTAASTGGLFPWSNPSRITTDDGSNATIAPGGSSSGFITGSTFGFNLPDFAVVDGISVLVDGSQTSATSTMEIGITGASTKTAVFAGATGGTTDLWGLPSIAISDLANIAVKINTTTIGAGGTAAIDYISVTVYWHIQLPNVETEVPTTTAYKVYSRNGSFLGELPNVTSKLNFSQDINTAGSTMTTICGIRLENPVTVSPLLTEAGDPILTEAGAVITTASTEILVAPGASLDSAIFKNGNRVKAWVYNKYYPNGKLIFSGQINKVQFQYGGGSAVTITVFSDGFDMANYLLKPSSSYSYTDDVTQNTQNASSTITLTTAGVKETIINRLFLGQTFTTGAIARLGAVKLLLEGSAEVQISLYSAVDGSYLGGGSKFVSNASPIITQLPFTLPINVLAATSYFFTVSVPNNSFMKVFRTTANPYAPGEAFQITTSSGWTALGGDLYFITQSASGGNTTTTFTADDPVAEMASAGLQDYNALGGYINQRNFTATGLSLTYTFVSLTIFNFLIKILDLSPTGYYMDIDLGTAEIDIKPVSITPDFTVVQGREINSLTLVLSIEQVVNYLPFVGGDTGGGDNLFREYADNDSVDNYGLRTNFQTDNRVTLTATADAIGETFIEENAQETQETSLTVLNDLIDISLLTNGKTIGFKNYGNFIDNLVLRIVRREPNFSDGTVTLTLGRLPIRMNDELQRLNRQLLNQQTIDNPSSPS